MSTPTKLYIGPRPDARPTEGVPTLRLPYDRARFPACCHRCGSGLVNLEGDRGESAPGMLTCGACSEMLAWVKWSTTR